MTDTSLAASGRPAATPSHGVSFPEAFRVWLRVAALSFGGPAGQIAVMHRIIVDEKRWVGENRFLHALSYCMLLPGPEAHQLAIYIGWLMHRWPGAIIAGGLFVLPGIVSIMALSVIYAAYGSVPVITALFLGLKAAVLAIVLHAVQRVGSRALKSRPMLVLAALAFIGIFFFNVPFPLIVIGAGIIGFIAAQAGSTAFRVGGAHGGGHASTDEGLLGADVPEHARPSLGRALRISALWLALWLLPVIVIGYSLGGSDVFTQIGLFFSKMAVVTFGGAYAPIWRSRRSRPMAGSGPARCWMGSAWQRRRPGRSSWWSNSSGFSPPIAIPAHCHRCWPAFLAGCSRRGAPLCRVFCGSGSALHSLKNCAITNR